MTDVRCSLRLRAGTWPDRPGSSLRGVLGGLLGATSGDSMAYANLFGPFTGTTRPYRLMVDRHDQLGLDLCVRLFGRAQAYAGSIRDDLQSTGVVCIGSEVRADIEGVVLRGARVTPGPLGARTLETRTPILSRIPLSDVTAVRRVAAARLRAFGVDDPHLVVIGTELASVPVRRFSSRQGRGYRAVGWVGSVTVAVRSPLESATLALLVAVGVGRGTTAAFGDVVDASGGPNDTD